MPGISRNRPIDTALQKNIITAMITDTEFLQKIRPAYKSYIFEVEYLQKLSRWITVHFDRYQEAPGNHIEDILESKRQGMELKKYNLIKGFLENLNERYIEGEYNQDYLFKSTMLFFRKRNWAHFHQLIGSHVQTGNIKMMNKLFKEFQDIDEEVKASKSINIETVRLLMENDPGQKIICLPGVLGDLLGWFERGWLIGILGSFKKGKTFWLQYIAHKCWEAGLNVAFASLEMSERAMTQRMMRYVCQQPEPGAEMIYDNLEAYTEQYGDRLRLFVYPCFSASVDMIYNDIRHEEQVTGWEADVVIIDHSDIILHTEGSTREGLDSIWKNLKKLAEDRNWLVLTASQTNRAAIDRETLSQTDAAEDIRKIAHSDCMIGLNQTPAEKEDGIMRINVISHRHNEFFPRKAVIVEQDLRISNPCRRSYYEEEARG